MTKFGALLREERKRAGKTMGELGRHLGCSVPYISDVELGRRPPPTSDRIVAAAALFGIDPNSLLTAAAEERGSIELHTLAGSSKRLEVSAGLMRRWAELSDEDLEAIEKVLERSSDKGTEE